MVEDALIDRKIDLISKEIDAVEELLGSHYESVISRILRLVRNDRPPKSRHPIWIVSDFLKRVSPSFPADIAELVTQYHEYWSDDAPSLTLEALNQQRHILHQRYLSAMNDAKSPGNRPVDLIVTTQWLTGDEPWETAQDGVIYYICYDLLGYGFSEAELKSELIQFSNEQSR